MTMGLKRNNKTEDWHRNGKGRWCTHAEAKASSRKARRQQNQELTRPEVIEQKIRNIDPYCGIAKFAVSFDPPGPGYQFLSMERNGANATIIWAKQ